MTAWRGVYSIFVGTLGLWARTNLFFRYKWLIVSIIIAMGLYEFLSFLPASKEILAFGVPVKIPGLTGSIFSFALAFFITRVRQN